MFLDLDFFCATARNLTQFATYNESLPQGAPTSPVIANLIFLNTCKKVRKYVNENNITFTTFLDDISFSSPNGFKKHATGILNIIKANRFFLNQDKIHYQLNRCEITAWIVSKGKLKLIPEMKRNAKENLHITG